MAKKNFEGMPLSATIQAWMDEQGWEDEIQINEERSSSQVAATVNIEGQPHRLFLEADEKAEQLSVYFYSAFNVPPGRMDAMVRILNRINWGLRVGRAACLDNGDAGSVQFRALIDVEGGALASKQVNTMVDCGISFFDIHGGLLAAVAMTKRPIDELWAEFVEEMNEEADTVPSEL